MNLDFPGAESVLPNDPFDKSLVDQVRPRDWQNPEPKERYNLVVLGGGTAGIIAAAGAAGLGAKVAMIERSMLGGDCLNTGCVPSKAVIRAARSAHEVLSSPTFGVRGLEGAHFDFGAAMARMRELRSHIAQADSAERMKSLGVDFFIGEGRFVADDAIEVAGARLTFRKAVIATGAEPFVPPIPGLDRVPYHTSETLFTLTELPPRMLVVGAGPIGCEMAQSFARMGSDVALLDRLPEILPKDDPDAALIVHEAMTEDGVHLDLGVNLKGLAPGPGGTIKASYDDSTGKPQELLVDCLLMATGRRPRIEGFGFDNAGIGVVDRRLVVDERLRTTNPRVYASGDVVGGLQFTHMADAMSRIVLRNALFFGRVSVSDLVVPWATYTDPEVAQVGLTAAEATERGVDIETFTIDFEHVDRAILEGERGFVRAHVRAGTDRIIGATIVGHGAGDLIGTLSVMMTSGLGLGALSTAIQPYPSRAMALKQLGDAWNRTRLTDQRKGWLARWFALFS